MRIGYQRNELDKYKNFTAVILAAGLSSRMKGFKPLLPVDGRPAIEGLVEAAKGAGIEDIVIVTGHEREKLMPVIRKYDVAEAYNPDYEQGMFTSIRTGLQKAQAIAAGKIAQTPADEAALAGDETAQAGDAATWRGCLLIPVDCPLVSIKVMRAVMDSAGENFAVPTFEGKKGHPLYIPAEFFEEIISHDGQGGLKAITDQYWDRMDRIPVNEEGCILDMDTPQGYEEIKQFVEMDFTRTKLSIAAARRRFILVRHGQTRQHEEPMFIGQYDVPLSEEGREQMRSCGAQIAALLQEHYVSDVKRDFFGNELIKDMPDWSNTVYCSDLSRAMESAEIVAEVLRGAGVMVDDEDNGVLPTGISVKPLEGLREIDLGDWDGRPIRQIKEQYPEEYERRGEDLFTFKIGNKSENFYDMQYRVIKCLRQILASDDGKNIIIISHSGVIRAIENNIKELRVDDEWKKIEKGQLKEVE